MNHHLALYISPQGKYNGEYNIPKSHQEDHLPLNVPVKFIDI
jgi:hypothetical protein